SASGNGRRRKSAASTRLKIAVLAPMPIAMIAMVNAVNAGVLRSERTAMRKSCARSRITTLTEGDPQWLVTLAVGVGAGGLGLADGRLKPSRYEERSSPGPVAKLRLTSTSGSADLRY